MYIYIYHHAHQTSGVKRDWYQAHRPKCSEIGSQCKEEQTMKGQQNKHIYIYIYLFAYMYMLALYASKSGVGAGTDYLYTCIESYRCAWRCWLDQGESSPCFLLVPTRICIQIIYSIYIYIYLQVYIYIFTCILYCIFPFISSLRKTARAFKSKGTWTTERNQTKQVS